MSPIALVYTIDYSVGALSIVSSFLAAILRDVLCVCVCVFFPVYFAWGHNELTLIFKYQQKKLCKLF